MRGNDLTHDSFVWNGCLYAPFHRIEVAAGRFLSDSFDFIDEFLVLHAEDQFRHGIQDRYVAGFRLYWRHLAAALVRGHSMTGRDVYDRDVIIFQNGDFESLNSGETVVIERVGEEQGTGAWNLKELRIEQARSFRWNEFGDEFDSNDLVIVLHSANPQILPWELDPTGQHHVRGIFRRVVHPEDLRFVEAEYILRKRGRLD